MPDLSRTEQDFALQRLRGRGLIAGKVDGGEDERVVITELGRNKLASPQDFRRPRAQFPRRGNNVPRETAAAPRPSQLTQDGAKEFIQGHYGSWRSGLTDQQYKGLAAYQSPLFPLINGRLRGVPPSEIKADVPVTQANLAKADAAVKGMDSAIQSAPPLKTPLTVHRTFAADQFGQLRPGAVITDNGYVSTSLTQVQGSGKSATGNAVAHITLPAGTRAAAGQSRELVLPRGSSFRVTGVRVRGGVTHVSMELVAVRTAEAAGHDVTPGHDELHHYWTVDPEGRAKWVDSPKPWTTLVAHLTPHVGPLKAKIYASRWFIEIFGFAAGSDLNRVTHGHPPRGHRVGPG